MHAHPTLAPWANFYVIAGSSAAALTGLMFVVITLIFGYRLRSAREGIHTFSTPTVVHFCGVLYVSAVMTAPWRDLVQASAAVALAGAFGVGYCVRVAYRTHRQTTYDPDVADWVWFVILPFVTYGAIASGALALSAPPGPFTVAGGVALLIFVGIHNAWDAVTFLAIHGEEIE